jgi:hypothetical protein
MGFYALQMMDEKYKAIRDDLPNRKTFFDDVRALHDLCVLIVRMRTSCVV